MCMKDQRDQVLEVMIEPNIVNMKKEKVQRVVYWPVLRSVKDVQKFLGLANYYKWFVKNFIRITKPLYEITRKNVKQNWRERQQKVFEKLKKRFTMEPVLITPDLDKKMRVKVKVLDFAIGGVLQMKCKDEKQRLVTYISKSLNEAEKNYEIHNKEMLAIIRCLESQRHFLEEVKIQFKIQMDHKNLKYFIKAQKLN